MNSDVSLVAAALTADPDFTIQWSSTMCTLGN